LSIKQESLAQNTLLHVAEVQATWGEAGVVHATHVAVREQAMMLPRNRLAACGNNTGTDIHTKATPAILAMIPLTKQIKVCEANLTMIPLTKHIKVCNAEAECGAVGLDVV